MVSSRPWMVSYLGKNYFPMFDVASKVQLTTRLGTNQMLVHEAPWRNLAGAKVYGPLVPFDATQTSADALIAPLGRGALGYHLLGTDALGRDVFAGLWRSSFTALLVGLGVVQIGRAHV